MTTKEKDDEPKAETKAEGKRGEDPQPEIVNEPADLRRWVQIGDNEHSWHLIDQEKTAGNPSPVITMCGQETSSHLFLDRLPGGSDSDPGLVAEDCYQFVGIPAPRGKKDDDEPGYQSDAEKATETVLEHRAGQDKATAKTK